MSVRRIRDKVCRSASTYLEPGEAIEAAFIAGTGTAPANDRAVVATNRRLLLFNLSFLGDATELLATADRRTQIGPCETFMHPMDHVFATPLRVHKRFHKDVAVADGWVETD
jgi:hypothetical protein